MITFDGMHVTGVCSHSAVLPLVWPCWPSFVTTLFVRYEEVLREIASSRVDLVYVAARS